MTTINPGGLRASLDIRDGNIAAIFLALFGVGLASALIPFIPQNPLGLAASVAFPVAFLVALGLRALQCLPLIPRIILTLLALRPLMDAVQSSHESSSSFSLQNAHAALIVALLIIAWRKSAHPYALRTAPNLYLLVLAGLTLLAWSMGGLSAGATFRFYSGNPVNETIGLDANGDRDNTDRPIKGINDLTKPILSPVDANGVAIRNGISGSHKTLLDLRLQYVVKLQSQRTAGFFWEIYNALNHVNFNNVIGNRNASQFGQSIVADTARQMQLGVRYTF